MRMLMSLMSIPAIVLVAFTLPVRAQDEADKKTLKRIVEEIELVPSLYARGETPPKAKALPKFSLTKLAGYPAPKKQTIASEREKWTKDKDQYAKDFSLRALGFEAAQESAAVPTFDTTITRAGVTIKGKAELLQKQAGLGMALFRLEGLLKQLQEADRTRELNKRWLVDGDFAQARLMGNVIYLYEYNFTLGVIRADALPELKAEHDGWRLTTRPRIGVTEGKAKALVKDRLKLLATIQKDHADTPWAYFAERESKRELGMAWEARGK